jgi:hypothetical protein
LKEVIQLEIWKDVKGFEGVYQISNKGRLKSFKKYKEGYILSNKNSKGDYLSVILKYGNLERHERLHQLVAEAFIPNPDPLNKTQVNHKDTNKQNNNDWNLEWVTPSENVRHAIKHNPNMIKGMNNYNQFTRPKTILQYTLSEKFVAEYQNSVEAAKATGVCQRNILQVASKDEYKPGMIRKQAGGFIWRYKDERRECGAS